MAGTRKAGVSERERACVPAEGWRSVHARTWTTPKLPTVDSATGTSKKQCCTLRPSSTVVWAPPVPFQGLPTKPATDTSGEVP